MKLFALRGSTCVLSCMLAIGSWVFGYYICSVPLGLLFTCILILSAQLLLATLAVLSLIAALHADRSARQRTALGIVILSIGCLPFVAPWKAYGFEYRVRQTGDASWQRLAADAQEMLRATTPNHQLPEFPDRHWLDRVLKLAETHPVLKLGEVKPKLEVKEDFVGIYWFSKPFGTLGVIISTNPSIPAPDSRKRISDVVTISYD